MVAPGGNDQLYVLPPTAGTEKTIPLSFAHTELGPEMTGLGGEPSTTIRVLIVFPSQSAVPRVSFTEIGTPVGYIVPPPGTGFGNRRIIKNPVVPVSN
jgi:hypothetical protein